MCIRSCSFLKEENQQICSSFLAPALHVTVLVSVICQDDLNTEKEAVGEEEEDDEEEEGGDEILEEDEAVRTFYGQSVEISVRL